METWEVVEAILLEYGMSRPAAVGMLWPVLLGIQLSRYRYSHQMNVRKLRDFFLWRVI